MGRAISYLSEKTFIPISFAVLMFGGVAWITSIYNISDANARDIQELKYEQNEFYRASLEVQTQSFNKLSEIENRLTRLETLIEKQSRK